MTGMASGGWEIRTTEGSKIQETGIDGVGVGAGGERYGMTNEDASQAKKSDTLVFSNVLKS